MMRVVTEDWAHRLGRWRKEIQEELDLSVSRQVQPFANDVRKRLQSNIRNGRVGGPPLTKAWRRDKTKRGMSTRKLIETGRMVENINVAAGKKLEGGEEGIVFGIGVFEGGSGLRKAPSYLPFVHERGRKDGSIPARPAWVRAYIEAKASSAAYQRLTNGKWFRLRSSSFKE